MIHGETRIIMRNPISNNIIKDIGSENTFQGSVIANALRSLGKANCRYNDHSAYLYRRALGGLLLFRDNITAPASFAPPTNKMVGNACYGVENNSTPIEMGSFNSSSSGADIGSILYVYDFTPSQAIGVISCACLTSDIGGYIGYGNHSGGRASTLKSWTDNWNTENLSEDFPFDNSECALRFDNTVYNFSFNNTSKKLIVRKGYSWITEGSINAGMKTGLRPDGQPSVVPDYEYDLSQAVSGLDIYSLSIVRKKGSNKALLFFNYNGSASTASGSTYYYYEFDTTNLANPLTKKSIVNTAPVTVSFGCYGGGVITCSGSGKTYLFDESSGIIKNTVANFATSGADTFMDYCLLNDDVSQYFYNNASDTLIPINTLNNGNYGTNRAQYTSDDYSIIYSRGYGSGNSVANNPLYLATINNFTEVEKTAELTMQVRYTLTES